MTPTERAEKIVSGFESEYFLLAKHQREHFLRNIAAQIEEAYAEGFRAAREKAIKITEHQPRCQFEFCDICDIAQRIAEIEP